MTSFESAAKLSRNSSSQVENIYLKYKFVIVPPKNNTSENSPRLESYSIEIRIVSRIAVENRLKKTPFLSAPPIILRLMGARTAFLKIEYSDYTVARSLQTTVSEWFSSLPCADESVLMEFLQSNSHHIPNLVRLMTVIFTCFFLYQTTVDNKKFFISDLNNLFQYSIIAFGLIFISYYIATWCARYIENSIDRWTPIAYVWLNKKDETEINKYEKTNRSMIIKVFFGFCASLCTSIATKVISGFIAIRILGIGHS